MGLTAEDVETCSPDALDAVAAAWERLSGAMSGDKDTVDREVVAPLKNGGWESHDGRRAIQLIGYVGDQLEAIRAESGAMASIVREAAGELRAAQNDLRNALESARHAGIQRAPDGRLSWTAANDAQNSMLEAEAKDIDRRILAALQRATDADMVAANTMRKNVDFGPKGDFNVRSLGGDPTADAARAGDLLALLDKGSLGDADLALLDTLLKQNVGNKAFDVQLMQLLGPERLMDATTNLEQLGKDGDPKKAGQTAGLIEDRLRTALGTASADLAGDAEWMRRLKDAGREVETSPDGHTSVYGYQQLSQLLKARAIRHRIPDGPRRRPARVRQGHEQRAGLEHHRSRP
ncbi:hypothetical protein [Streptomyces sp. SID3343]|uniref:hypothetical protein n=1 Tax=Streptomyces sp. SID3343 TaxID=2690260 RepID=UPI00136F7CA4|nr:hypothetical protein [Streptomyces sp. SID3343]MYW00899.1 hypothetical protein [Streptomyces sp. SID3343]